jgi:hypothetical protein
LGCILAPLVDYMLAALIHGPLDLGSLRKESAACASMLIGGFIFASSTGANFVYLTRLCSVLALTSKHAAQSKMCDQTECSLVLGHGSAIARREIISALAALTRAGNRYCKTQHNKSLERRFRTEPKNAFYQLAIAAPFFQRTDT